jgi:CheY-like chemotaxis protein
MKKVIIAEPVLRILGLGNTLFGRGGITVYPARTSEEIFALHQENRADLIITASSLPVIDGATLCSAIRCDAALRDVSLVVVCDADGPTLEQCLQAGANAIMASPADPFELFSRISELLVIPQRQDMRVLLQVTAKGRKNAVSFPGVSHNISISGMLIEAEPQLENGESLACIINIGGREIAAEGEVVRVEQTTSGRFRYGVKFARLDTKSLIIIEQFVKGKIRH